MNHKFKFFIIFLLGLMLLSACSPAIGGAGAAVLPTAVATITIPTAVPTTAVSPTPTATQEAESETAVPTATTVAQATAVTVLNTNVQYVLALSNVNIRSGPGTGYDVIGWVADGQTAKVTGVNGDNSWWRVICPDDSIGSCWVTAGSQYTQPTTAPINQPAPTATSAVCVDAATFVSDVSVPDGTQFAPNTGFNKTWRIKNSGTCTWDHRYKLIHAGGHVLGALSTALPLPATVAPGQTIDLTVSLVAPAQPGAYQGDWKLQNPQAQAFGVGRNQSNPFWIKIMVTAPQVGNNSIISGFAWQDKDHDNVVDGNEYLPRVAIALATGTNCGSILGTVQTDNNGRFTFNNLAATTYCLFGSDGTVTVSQSGLVLGQNQQLTDVKVAWPPLWQQPTVITGLVYQDSNGNGVYNNGEPLVANREVWLIPGTACHVQSHAAAVAFSGADGRYTLAGEFNGSYCVGLNGNGGLDDVIGIAVNSGQTLHDINLKAYAATGSITGWLWNDYCLVGDSGVIAGNCVADGNGSYYADGQIQPSEGYIAGVSILLQASPCSTDNPATPLTAVTDASGKYTFNNLLPGTYCVFMNAAAHGNANILLPGDWTFPQLHIWYQQITLAPGEQATPVNFGWDYQFQ